MDKTSKKAAAEGKAPAEVKATVVKNFDDLQRIIDLPVHANVLLNGQLVQIPCRRITPAESYELELVLKECLPPQRTDPERATYFDIDDPQYKAAKDAKRVEVRCLAAYMGCPLYREKKPGLKDRKEIVEFVQGQFSDVVLRSVAGAVLEGDFDEWEQRIMLF